jgi:hypothetical protein
MKNRCFWFMLGIIAAGLTTWAQDSGKQNSGKSDIKKAGQDVKKAGGATGRAAKHTGRAAKKSTKRAVNKTADATGKGADKVKEKTK